MDWKRGLWLPALLLIPACRDNPLDSEESEPVVCTVPFTPKSTTHEVVGFYPWYRHESLPPAEIRWDKLTRVIYAFAVPTADGTLDTSRVSLVDPLVTSAHANGVEAYVSIGGGGLSGDFPLMAANEKSRRRFVTRVRDYLGAHCLDGVDIDWEAWTKDALGRPLESEMDNLVLLLTELREELHPLGLHLSIDVYAGNWGGQHYRDAVEDLVDEVYVMAYDFSGPWSGPGPHSSYEQAIGSGSTSASTGLAYWVGYRGWDKQKIYLGVPFYGRDFDLNGGEGVTYRDILARYPEAAEGDRVANIYYNGPATIEAKTRYVVENGYPGIMIWEIAQDTQEESTSLLSAIADALGW